MFCEATSSIQNLNKELKFDYLITLYKLYNINCDTLNIYKFDYSKRYKKNSYHNSSPYTNKFYNKIILIQNLL